MSNIKIHVLHTGAVCVAPDLPFGGDHCNAIKASGIFQPRKNRLWLPVSAYLIEHPKGMFLVDTGWARAMSPNGEFDKKAQIKSLGSVVLYEVNQGQIPLGECVDEQLAAMGMRTSDIDAVLITHLDCDHANGIVQVKDVKRFAPFDFFRSRCAAYNTTFRVPSSSEQSGCINAPVPVTHVSTPPSP